MLLGSFVSEMTYNVLVETLSTTHSLLLFCLQRRGTEIIINSFILNVAIWQQFVMKQQTLHINLVFAVFCNKVGV